MRYYYVKNPYRYDFMNENGMRGKQKRIFGEALLAYRRQMGYSRQTLSEIVQKESLKYGVKFTYWDIYGYEKRRISPKIDKLTALCRATQMPLSYFTGHRTTNKPSFSIAA